MPSSKRSRTPPAAPAPAPAAAAKASAPPPARSLQETFNQEHVAAGGLILAASVPALLIPVTDGLAESSVIVVSAIVMLTLGTLILDRRQWMLEGRRQMLLTLVFGALAAATSPAVPIGLDPADAARLRAGVQARLGRRVRARAGVGSRLRDLRHQPGHELPLRARDGLAGDRREPHAAHLAGQLRGRAKRRFCVAGAGRVKAWNFCES